MHRASAAAGASDTDWEAAGSGSTAADCAAACHLPLVSLSTKLAYGRDALEGIPQVKPYLKMLNERPAFAQVSAWRKEATAKK